LSELIVRLLDWRALPEMDSSLAKKKIRNKTSQISKDSIPIGKRAYRFCFAGTGFGRLIRVSAKPNMIAQITILLIEIEICLLKLPANTLR
jgi:hypothetical protein